VRLILRVVEIALLALAGLYAGDYLSARYRIPGNRQTLGSVQVRTLWAVRMKNGRFEYSLGDTETQTCVRSLFPQLGYTPCWYLSRHATRRIEVSRAGADMVLEAAHKRPYGRWHLMMACASVTLHYLGGC
jgi:hypothetical protein